MCIAISKPIGVDVPSEEILKNCWYNNDDGAGFAFNYDNRVFIKKGFMRFDDFMKAFNEYNQRYNFKNCGLLIHFRIATHGGKGASMTHPFPIIDDEGCLKKIEYVSDYAVIHNGIISLTTSEANKSNGMSDTAVFIKKYLTKIAGNKAWLRKPCNMELIEELIDSKMAILDKYGNIKMTSGFTEDKGVYYSNSSYKDTYTRVYTNYYNKLDAPYSSYGWDDSWGNYGIDDYYGYGGYGYDCYDYDDYIADKVDNSKSTKYSSLLKPLMKLKSGWFIECNGYSDQVSNDMEYYIDSKYSLYMSEPCESLKYKEYYYLGECEVYDQSIKSVPFKRDTWAYTSQFDVDFSSDDEDIESFNNVLEKYSKKNKSKK